MKHRSVLAVPVVLIAFATIAGSQPPPGGGGFAAPCQSMSMADPGQGEGWVVLDTGFSLESDRLFGNQDLGFVRSCSAAWVNLGAQAQPCGMAVGEGGQCAPVPLSCGLNPEDGVSLCGCQVGNTHVTATLRVGVARGGGAVDKIQLYVNARRRPLADFPRVKTVQDGWSVVLTGGPGTITCKDVTLELERPTSGYYIYQVQVAAMAGTTLVGSEPVGYHPFTGESETYYLRVAWTGEVTLHRTGPFIHPEPCSTCTP